MKFLLEIDCDNAAFADDGEAEVARILQETANTIMHRFHYCSHNAMESEPITLRDINGNSVGTASVTID